MAVPIGEFPQRGKSIVKTRLKLIVLSLLTDDDISHIAHGFFLLLLEKKET